jgi:hypothetical protein
MKRHSTSAFCPIAIDTPVQQDQDPTNAARMITFCLCENATNSQLIVGTVIRERLRNSVSEELSHQLHGRLSVPAALDQCIKNITIGIDGLP